MKSILLTSLVLAASNTVWAGTWVSNSGITRISNLEGLCEANGNPSAHYSSRIGGVRISGRVIVDNVWNCFEHGFAAYGRFTHTQRRTGITCRGNLEANLVDAGTLKLTWHYDSNQSQCRFAGGSIESPLLSYRD